MKREDVFVLLYVVVGIVLLLNPFYLYPDGGGKNLVTYTLTEIESEAEAKQALSLSDDVLECPNTRSCVLEERVLEEGEVRYNGTIQNGPPYSIVWIRGLWYRPVTEVRSNSSVLTITELTPMQAVEHASIPEEEISDARIKPITGGNVTILGEPVQILEQGQIIESGSTYYYTTSTRSRDHWTGGALLPLVRAVLVVLGCGAVLRGGIVMRGKL
jgi:hypothetical protein